jgi:hypothetical protein
MPLLRPPDPKISTRKFYVRIEEPLAITLERYAEFLGTTGIDHVVNQALEFVFRKDTDFKDWLVQHQESTPRKNLGQAKKSRSSFNTRTVASGGSATHEEEAIRP